MTVCCKNIETTFTETTNGTFARGLNILCRNKTICSVKRGCRDLSSQDTFPTAADPFHNSWTPHRICMKNQQKEFPKKSCENSFVSSHQEEQMYFSVFAVYTGL
ncbi:hypothetical protein XENOCAPTIV_015148 [Xenoophorus captivus]|uniref:Uncharacterized protein n=1 Tax=Xenoophorus captivus TaxID=1517983 RepID=A0ABV0SFG5_9TELE